MKGSWSAGWLVVLVGFAARVDADEALGPRFSAAAESLSSEVEAYAARAVAPRLAPAGYGLTLAAAAEEESDEVIVSASGLVEEDRVGPNEQPRWTTRRRFPTTRAYVLEPFQIEAETWWRGKFRKNGEGTDHRFQQEIGIGLPYRLQLDIYESFEDPHDGDFGHSAVQVEVRWALAKWGRIPLNPTIYVEHVANRGGPDAIELKLLLAEELGRGWHWAINFIYEQVTGGERDRELAISTAVSYTLLDDRLSVGLEIKFENASVAGARGDSENELLIGPSVQWILSPRVHVAFAPLIGVTSDSPRVEAYLVVGFDLSPREGEERGRAPTSTRSR